MRLLLILMMFASTLLAIPTGELSLYMIKEGKPLAEQTIVIFKRDEAARIDMPSAFNKHAEFVTDKDGFLYTVLPQGTYQLQVVAKEDGKPQAFVKKSFVIKENKESQLIISLKKDDSIAFIDEETPKGTEQKSSEEIKTKAKGVVAIQLRSSEDDQAIQNARIFVKGLKIDVKSDKKGYVELNIPEGNQTISIIHSDFSSQTLKVSVLANETLNKFVEMSPASMELDEFVVLAPQVEGSVASLTAEKKNSSAIADILGSEQMAKKGDSNAASALKRVSGVTLVDGKNIYIRGLGERYSNVELNSMPLPSPNPVKRVVPLDIFPSGIIGSLKVQKTYSADIPGNFAGGYIDIRTKEDISEDYVKLQLALKAHSSALDGTQGNYYQGGSTDFLGIDDGTRSIPDSVLQNGEVVVGERPPRFSPFGTGLSQDDILAMTKELAARKINTHQGNVPLGGKGTLEVSKKFELNSDHSIGLLANYTYDQSHKHITEEFYGYSMDGTGNIADEADTFGENARTYSQYKQSFMLNLGYNYADIFKIKYTTLYLLDTLERTRITDGVIGSNYDLQRFYSLDWEERVLFSNQVTGAYNHRLWSDATLDFGAEWSMASFNQPDNVKYEYIDNSGTGNHYELKTQSAQNLIHHNMTSDDDVMSIYLKEHAEMNLFSKEDTVELGFNFTTKTRESRSNKFYMKANKATNITQEDLEKDPDYIQDKYIINSTDTYFNSTFLVDTLFSPSDYYDADLIETGLYLKTALHPTESFEVVLGARQANVTQTLHEYQIDPATGNVVIVDNDLVINKLLPQLDARYKFTEDDQLRFGFSETYVYPDFREFSSSGYFHPDEAATVIGNPNLVSTDIMNVDTRFEHYYSPTESWSTALFYKYLDNPIEDVSVPSTSLPVYSYANTDSATLMGIELDIYKNFDFISNDLKYFFASSNFTYTHSDVTLSEEQTQQFTTNQRALQGLSPMVFNASLGYDNTDGRSINFAYNKMSDRIRKVGLKNGVQEYPDQYEIPPHILDFTWQERIMDGMDMRFKARNLLDGEIIWVEGDNVTKRYKAGRSFELSISYKY